MQKLIHRSVSVGSLMQLLQKSVGGKVLMLESLSITLLRTGEGLEVWRRVYLDQNSSRQDDPSLFCQIICCLDSLPSIRSNNLHRHVVVPLLFWSEKHQVNKN